MSNVEKPRASRRLRSPLPEPYVRDRLLVIRHRSDTLWGWLSKRQGLFSEFFAVLGALRYAEQHGAAGVRVEFTSPLYRDPSRDTNWWAYFFEPVMWLGEPRPAGRALCCNGWHRYGPHAWNESWTALSIPSNTDRQPYPINAESDAREVSRLTARYIRVLPEWSARTDAFWSARTTPADFVIGVHYRGTDKVNVYPYRSPDYRVYGEQIDRVLARHQPGSWRLFIATDETEFADWAKVRYGERVFTLDEAPRLSARDPEARKHGTHKNRSLSGVVKGGTAVLDCLLLSRCHHLIKNRSSLSDISLAFNPSLPWTFILDDQHVHESGVSS